MSSQPEKSANRKPEDVSNIAVVTNFLTTSTCETPKNCEGNARFILQRRKAVFDGRQPERGAAQFLQRRRQQRHIGELPRYAARGASVAESQRQLDAAVRRRQDPVAGDPHVAQPEQRQSPGRHHPQHYQHEQFGRRQQIADQPHGK